MTTAICKSVLLVWPCNQRHNHQRRKLNHHKATTTYLQSRAPEVNLFRSRSPSRFTSSWRVPRTVVVHYRLSAPRPWTRICRHTQCQTSHTITLYGTILSINTCNLPFYYASKYAHSVRRPTSGPANQVLSEANQVRQIMFLLYVRLSYIIVPIDIKIQ